MKIFEKKRKMKNEERNICEKKKQQPEMPIIERKHLLFCWILIYF
jgi:hypothetical protein